MYYLKKKQLRNKKKDKIFLKKKFPIEYQIKRSR